MWRSGVKAFRLSGVGRPQHEVDPFRDELQMFRKTLGGRIRDLRTLRGWSQRNLVSRVDSPAVSGARSEFTYRDHSFSLSLAGAGAAVRTRVKANRIEFCHHGVTEWFVNDPRSQRCDRIETGRLMIYSRARAT
jgi:hypothetical protein